MPAEEQVYDAFLNACLAGEIPDPEAFLARHPGAGPLVRERIEALRRMLREDTTETASEPLAADEDLPVERLGEFRLLRRLDSGGMGSVFLAEQESLGRVVALKIVRPELQGSREAIRRFEREAEAVARLRHSNIVTVLGAGTDHDTSYLAMELVQGRRLDDWLGEVAAGREALSTRRIVRWIVQLARALGYAHGQGVVHRDVKPANIRVTPDDRPLLLDFGVAHLMGQEAGTLTRTFAGSPTYAAPEQIDPRAGGVDGRTDVYALGVTLYQCLTGVVPFTGDTVEQVFHRTLTEEPAPPRRLKHTVGRDLEIVCLKAMEKDPAARYGSAADLADDLDAVLEHRPIRARPPAPWTRVLKWARRRPAAAVAVASALLLVAILAGQRLAERAADRARARGLVADARERITEYNRQRENSAKLENEVQRLLKRLPYQYFEPEEDRVLREGESQVRSLHRARERTFYEILDLLRRAERLDPDVLGSEALRAELYLEKFEEAGARQDPEAQAAYRELVEAHDQEGRLADRLYGWGRLAVETEPADAEAFLFRFRELAELHPDGERRLVPVPVGAGEPPVPHGTLVRRVVEAAGGLERGDLILDDEVELPDGAHARWTAAPVFLGPAARIGRAVERVEPGHYLLVLRREGYEELRYAFRIVRKETVRVALALNANGTTPRGFVYIPPDGKGPEFWIQEREVTCAEYLAFLNAPETRAEIATAKGRLIRVPRNVDTQARGGSWPRGADGRYRIDAAWRPDWPMIEISWNDARAYARWAGRRDGREYALPTHAEWLRAGGSSNAYRLYPFGNVFRPKWVNSNWSRPTANVEPVLTYPIDESPFGVFDMSGSAAEWLDAWFDEGRNLRHLGGGSWGHGDPMVFKVYGGFGMTPQSTSGVAGFRLVFRKR